MILFLLAMSNQAAALNYDRLLTTQERLFLCEEVLEHERAANEELATMIQPYAEVRDDVEYAWIGAGFGGGCFVGALSAFWLRKPRQAA